MDGSEAGLVFSPWGARVQNNIDIAFGVDEANLDHVAVVIRSICETASDQAPLRFHILFMGDDAEKAARRVSSWGYPNARLIPTQHLGRSVQMKLSEASLLRLQLPHLLPDVHRVVYLDADLVVRADIAELFHANLDGMPVGGVVDIALYIALRRELVQGRDELRDYLISIGQDPGSARYINTGVLVMDLDALRAMKFSDKARSVWNARAEQLKYKDQCLLNIVLLDRIAYLDPRWNVMAITMNPRRLHYAPDSIFDQLALQRSGEERIIHYAGPRKPWNDAETWRLDDWWMVANKTGVHFSRPVPAAETLPRRLRRRWNGFTQRLSTVRAQLSRR